MYNVHMAEKRVKHLYEHVYGFINERQTIRLVHAVVKDKLINFKDCQTAIAKLTRMMMIKIVLA